MAKNIKVQKKEEKDCNIIRFINCTSRVSMLQYAFFPRFYFASSLLISVLGVFFFPLSFITVMTFVLMCMDYAS